MSYILSRPIIPIALLLALLAFLTLTALASAETAAEQAESDCLLYGSGAEVIEVTDAHGNVLSSTCYHDGKEVWTYNFGINPGDSSAGTVGETRVGGLGQVPTDGALDGVRAPRTGVVPGSGTVLNRGE